MNAIAATTSEAASSDKRGVNALFRRVLMPLFLLSVCPPFAIVVWHTHTALDGSLVRLYQMFAARGALEGLRDIWGPVFFGSPTAWLIIGSFAAFELALMRFLPGPDFRGPVTPAGNVPVYKQNGPAAFVVTLATFAALSAFGVISPSIVYDNFGAILGAINTFALLFCLGLYFKGRFSPSSADASTSGNPIFDYYWGTELHPRVLGWDVKMFTNCRFGMMGWAVIIVSFAAKQHMSGGLSSGMLVAVGLQLFYIAKFFLWETGYLGSLDIMHDRAGFYICWGCLVWVPSTYTSATLYLVKHPVELGVWAPLLAAAGVAAILVNYLADAQRQAVRAADGKTTVWGKPPVLIRAEYTTQKGERKESLLLASGYWGIARHFHYVPELLGAFFWTLPVLFDHLLPWFYPIFLAILLFDRAFRDDKRCAAKYGPHWAAYCAQVRYKIIPGIL